MCHLITGKEEEGNGYNDKPVVSYQNCEATEQV
jgi:hypothetical protein